MSLFKKVHKSLTRVGRKVGFSKRASKLWARSITGDFWGVIRAVQRSHKLGKFGHSIAPSMSESNLVTRAYNKLMSNMSRSALRAAERQAANSSAANSASAAVQTIPQQRLDYAYRRLSDLT